ncbi:uncharacterized protein BX664DRAFT_343948 [Halteromyces radiatus]|uniref:uncharacterized protein n=1 Tax=Halteromyces radiatus TaxID=101107 RepID=UPI00221EA1F4|nr:uncharacterized protein BX664DRAFT_343948 [Halteromyces radiatus]KAI8076798.1 hypothetical protein BX664DRAFT_343948 [Halteromyces radiatus]
MSVYSPHLNSSIGSNVIPSTPVTTTSASAFLTTCSRDVSDSSDSEDDLNEPVFGFRIANPDPSNRNSQYITTSEVDSLHMTTESTKDMIPSVPLQNSTIPATESSSQHGQQEEISMLHDKKNNEDDGNNNSNNKILSSNISIPKSLSRSASKTLQNDSLPSSRIQYQTVAYTPSESMESQSARQRASIIEPFITNTTSNTIHTANSMLDKPSSLQPQPSPIVVPPASSSYRPLSTLSASSPKLDIFDPTTSNISQSNISSDNDAQSSRGSKEEFQHSNQRQQYQGETLDIQRSSTCSIDKNDFFTPSSSSANPASGTRTSILATSPNVNSTTRITKYNQASYSLTNNPQALKMYRDMAEKTQDETIQLSYAKYLLEVAALYEPALGTMTSTDGKKEEERQRKKKQLEQEGVRWINKLSKKGVGEAAYMEATWLETQQYGYKTKHASRIDRLYQIAANAGVPDASYQLASRMESTGQSSYNTFLLYQKAADQQCVKAIYKMSKIYLHGELDQPRNLIKGMDYLVSAVNKADTTCNEPPYVLALILTNKYSKVIVPSEIVQTYGGTTDVIKYLEQSANLGNVGAKNRAGHIYEHGSYGVPMNMAKAFLFYEEAAKKGTHLQSMLALSRLYNGGCHGPSDQDEQSRLANDVSGWLQAHPKNEELSFYWCQRAAKSGLPDALFLLGWYYEIGLGVPRDYQYSMDCYQEAANKGHKEAKARFRNTIDDDTIGKTSRHSTADRLSKRSDDCIIM